MNEPVLDVIGIGNAIVDVLAEVDDETLQRRGVTKGAMTLIDAERAEALYAQRGRSVERSGGSAANTMVGIASLGGKSAYVGKVGADPLGELFRRDLRGAGVLHDTPAADGGPSTGRCMVWVTPDAQRTMLTYLGASATLTPDDIVPDSVRSARVTYLEGYLWDPPPAKRAFLEAAEIAHGAGRKVALSLSDPFCVERHREEFRELVAGRIDILFANEDEIVSLYEAESFDAALRSVRGACEIAALTRGAGGSVVVAGETTTRVEAEPVARVVDTTGAGDLYASGFLFGLTSGRDIATSARIGGIAAAAVLGRFGARPDTSLAVAVREKLG
jgi:sugar/nucleoside kinase (ribokinase family)